MTASESTSRAKLEIRKVQKSDGYNWIEILLLKWGRPGDKIPSFLPSLCDLHRVIQAIAECEDEKYPPPAKGRVKLIEFLRDAVRESNWATLARKHKIPDRDEHGRVVNTNGADIGRVAANTRRLDEEITDAERARELDAIAAAAIADLDRERRERYGDGLPDDVEAESPIR